MIVTADAFDVPPPGGGRNTVTCAVAALAISAAVMFARSCVAPTNVVVRSLPFHRTTAFEAKPVPFTISVNAVPPATADVGDSDVTLGAPGTMVTGGLVAPRV